jgi:type IV pilus assembly protein PilM
MLKSRNKQTKNVVGLELDPAHVAAAEVSVNGGLSVKRGGVSMLRPGVLRDGEVTDPVALAETLRQLFAENDLPTRVRLGVANQRIVVRSLDLPLVKDGSELEELVRAQAGDHIPMPMDEAVLDYQDLGVVATPGGPRTRVMIVAVRREMVDRLAGACDAAGLTIEGIDLSAFAMVRALPQPAATGATLYVNVAGLVNVAVANATGCLFTRTAAGGVEAMVETLAERRGLTVEHARQWLTHVGLEQQLDAIVGDAAIVGAARGVLEEGVHQLADTVRNSLNFYRMQETAETVDHGLITGPAVAIPGLVDRLAEQLNLPLEPFVLPFGDEGALSSRLTLAAGLGVEDRT